MEEKKYNNPNNPLNITINNQFPETKNKENWFQKAFDKKVIFFCSLLYILTEILTEILKENLPAWPSLPNLGEVKGGSALISMKEKIENIWKDLSLGIFKKGENLEEIKRIPEVKDSMVLPIFGTILKIILKTLDVMVDYPSISSLMVLSWYLTKKRKKRQSATEIAEKRLEEEKEAFSEGADVLEATANLTLKQEGAQLSTVLPAASIERVSVVSTEKGVPKDFLRYDGISDNEFDLI